MQTNITSLRTALAAIDIRINDYLNNNPYALDSVKSLWSFIKLEVDNYAGKIKSIGTSGGLDVYIPFSSITTRYVDDLINNSKFEKAREVIRGISQRIEQLEEEISFHLPATTTSGGSTPTANSSSVTSLVALLESLTRSITEQHQQTGSTTKPSQ